MISSTMTICLVCQKTIAKTTSSNSLCPVCYKMLDVRYNKKEAFFTHKVVKKIIWINVIILTLSLVTTLHQFPSLLKITKPIAPLHLGDKATSHGVDKCIKKLWEAARMMQEGQWPKRDFKCPSSGFPYIKMVDKKRDWITLCPSPRSHNVKNIKVRRSIPIPEVIQ